MFYESYTFKYGFFISYTMENRLPSGMTEDSLNEDVNLLIVIILTYLRFWNHNNNICNCIEQDEK